MSEAPDLIYMYSIHPVVKKPVKTYAKIETTTVGTVLLVETKSAYGCQAILMSRSAAKVLSDFNSLGNDVFYTSDGAILRAAAAGKLTIAHLVGPFFQEI